MEVIWHNHLRADPCPMRRTVLPEAQKSFVDSGRRKKCPPMSRAGGDEVNWRAHEQTIETMQALFPNFGAHRAPLQWVSRIFIGV